MKRIAVIIPSYAQVPVQFLWSVIGLYQQSKKYKLDLYGGYCCFLADARNRCVTDALKAGADYILWLDVDQTYPSKTIDTLVKHLDGGKSIVGGLTLKRANKRPMVFTLQEGYLQQQRVMVRGMTKCDAMGMGGVMVKPKVFDKIGFPYFNTGYLDGDVRHVSDDVYFYRKCKDAGFDVWCDGDLKYGHLRTEEI